MYWNNYSVKPKTTSYITTRYAASAHSWPKFQVIDFYKNSVLSAKMRALRGCPQNRGQSVLLSDKFYATPVIYGQTSQRRLWVTKHDNNSFTIEGARRERDASL